MQQLTGDDPSEPSVKLQGGVSYHPLPQTGPESVHRLSTTVTPGCIRTGRLLDRKPNVFQVTCSLLPVCNGLVAVVSG